MAISSKSYQALNTLKQANVIDPLIKFIEILITKTAPEVDPVADEPLDDLEQSYRLSDLIFDGQGQFKVNGSNVELQDYDLTLSDLLYPDENDAKWVTAINCCLVSWSTNIPVNSTKDEDLQSYRTKHTKLASTATAAQIRAEFLENHFFEGSDAGIVVFLVFAGQVLTRLKTFTTSTGTEEDASNTEEKNESETNTILNQLEVIFEYGWENDFIDYKIFVERIFNSRNLLSNSTLDRKYVIPFNRAFSDVNTTAIKDLSESKSGSRNFKNLIAKLEDLGIFQLASYAYEISEFTKRRLKSVQAAKTSAADFIDPNADTQWLLVLGDVVKNLKQDPITFASINYYIPSLITFLLDALAAVADYSNNGKGGGEDDPLNNPEFIIDSLEKAFGITSDGKKIFTMAFKVDNTSERIKKVIESSPFRANIQPNNPDIFHLRLGAANFYVPPVMIDVNTNFKTGSLTGAAIRQKNSPKYNSGYKETTIRMRLFFPNYQEIWGIDISDATAIDLNEDFKIDFKNGGDTELKIDKFLSSLRGLVAAFKYAPFLPIKNHYLNSVHGITGVALSGMTVSSVPNFPFALSVDLELLNFNHQPFLPMIKDFNQAIHWGKFRQYMGKAAGYLHKYVNEEFLLKTSDIKTEDQSSGRSTLFTEGSGFGFSVDTPMTESLSAMTNNDEFSNDLQTNVLRTNIIDEWTNGNNITLFAPAETQTKIFLPDTASFRSEEEKLMGDLSQSVWDRVLKIFGIDINQSAGYGMSLSSTIDASRESIASTSMKKLLSNSIDLLTAGINSENSVEKIYKYLATSFVQENSNNPIIKDEEIQKWFLNYNPSPGGSSVQTDWNFQGQKIQNVSLNAMRSRLIEISRQPTVLLDYITDGKVAEKTRRLSLEEAEERKKIIEDSVKKEVTTAFNVLLYERFFKSGPIQALMEASRLRNGDYQFNEWEVPMLRVDLDPKSVIVNGVTVSLRNTFAKLQVQMQDEPSYQHIGGGDSYIDISMTVIGENELIKLKNLFSHISGLARLEHATGVIGFLGIKNIITALSGIKYVLPINYTVSTVPNYPHVYNVRLSLTDFDIFQQQREKLSSSQQKKLIEDFATKRNPFLRIKQLWGAFNAYPDFPLELRDKEGEIVGHLDPDFYFRSFEMFDKDVVNSFSNQQPRVQDFEFGEAGVDYADVGVYANRVQKILEFMRLYSSTSEYTDAAQRVSGNFITVQKLVDQMVEYMNSEGMTKHEFLKLLQDVSQSETTYTTSVKAKLLTDFINISNQATENNPFLEEVNPAPHQVGNISPNSLYQVEALQAALEGNLSLEDEEFVSFDPDDVDFHKQIFTFPAADADDIANNRIPAVMQTGIGNHFGYIDRSNGRFYLTANGANVNKESQSSQYKLASNYVEDTQTPDRGNTNANTGVSGVVAVSAYQHAYDGDVYRHWEKMMVDTSYRDVSGRMIRAFPTYMLWLIDEGGYFAGVKLFDNFYGLQSIIDFSVVSSEDLLGDTLIFRVSNLYSKLTTPESTAIFNPNIDDFNQDELSLTEGLGSIIDRTLNISRNILSGMRNEYVVDINNIRLKPGVRVHLRVGYGSNPNSLQTVFNGVITNVDAGEIVTVTAQSDAIELGAVVNSVNKKGDSGKIDGGVDTGMYLSEPRDLMVRLLSMGSSRTREAIARSTRGTVFSENRFGIRHFGVMLYEPLTQQEQDKNDAIRANIQGAYAIAGGNGSFMNKAVGITQGFSFNLRGNTLTAMGQLFSNFCAQTDLELFKRNIYPGNGTGIAQFLGGDLDDGWSTASSLTQNDSHNSRLEGYLGRLTDYSFNRLVANSETGVTGSSNAIDDLVRKNELINSEGRAGLVKGAFGVAATGLSYLIGGPVTGTLVGASLTGILRGRGGTNLFRLMGIVSPNPDDDLPGFDEVSFRAQTYMRSVWDMFQTCARLLPNYIVAIRPFEDRSTVFYGKPHWLYTSGVVPVTTGFPGEEKAQELGIIPPRTREPDADLISILDRVNKESNPYADYSAFFAAAEPSESIQRVSENMMTSSGIYAPTSYLSGKIIDFYSKPSVYHINPDKPDEVLAKVPKSKGIVNVGFHLPIGGLISEDIIQKQDSLHKQLPNLPARYQYPYFAATERIVLENSSTLKLSDYEKIFDKVVSEDYDDNELLDDLAKMYAMEIALFKETKQSLIPSDANGDESVVLDNPLNLYDLNTMVMEIPFDQLVIRMPIPNIDTYRDANVSQADIDDDYSFEYQDSNYGKLTYQEWGSPKTPEDEQFYIAMRWPYTPEGNDSSAIEKFKSEYDLDETYGKVEDYKNRKVLVYNPINNRAVVCRPAYFLWGEDDDTDAIVSPDAAYFLGIITYNNKAETQDPFSDDFVVDTLLGDNLSGFRPYPEAQECYMAFVPDNVPVGTIALSSARPTTFKLQNADSEYIDEDNQYLIGFGGFKPVEGSDNLAAPIVFADKETAGRASLNGSAYYSQYAYNNSLSILKPYQTDFVSNLEGLSYGGNVLRVDNNTTYFKAVLEGQYDKLEREALYNILDDELATTGSSSSASGRVSFAPVFDMVDMVSVQARQFYDENFDASVSVIAGNGRTLSQAQDIWDQFRFGYHTYESVKQIFFEMYGLDPDSEDEFPPYIRNLISPTANNYNDLIERFDNTTNGGDRTARDEFAILLGSDYVDSLSDTQQAAGLQSAGAKPRQDYLDAIEFVRQNYVDADLDDGGLVQYFNTIIVRSLQSLRDNFFSGTTVKNTVSFSLESNEETDAAIEIAKNIKTPKQLFLLMVGIFRQRMWEDPYARAWLVLKPDRKKTGKGEEGQWSFKPVDKVFRAFIDPHSDYAKPSKKDKFIQLLIATRGEGNSSTNIVSDAIEGIDNFWDSNIGPIFSAIGDGLGGMLSMFKLSMQQMGYALSEAGNFKKQANILNKALNDSIYYSLGREGTLLRAVDNPFTREYGEPVIEVREPFQRIHYLSSFSHILTNQIQENLNNVATVVTAVSDGKYPVTVALDKGAPAERQTEKTIETGIYFDNMTGSGFLGFLHPLMHPLETFRGAAKNIQGAPDELSARRVALSHLKESIKDIYQGELVIIGNADIRPHDLVYLSDVYERMYGIFEVEQVVHHFTPDLGYITAITPNALVTINDPARWFMTSWIHSWMNVQNIRNDTRIYLDRIRDGNSGVTVGGNISMEALGEALTPQIVGGMQFTHGSTALVKDIMANQTAQSLPNAREALIAQANSQSGGTGNLGALIMGGLANSVPIVGQLAWKGWKWVRDNVLDQHGCYVQYLNRNGQPMDAGLSYNQGMVVGQHHSKSLLGPILGVRKKVRTPEGHAYIRSDDLFKSLGWKETEIRDLVRYVSYENALTHARVLELSGLGPEKAGLERQFRVICKVTDVKDGDTIDVEDVTSGAKFTVRFDGINTSETNEMEGKINHPSTGNPSTLNILDISTPGGAAKIFVKKALINKLIILRVNPTREGVVSAIIEDDSLGESYDAGASANTNSNYRKDTFDRTIGTVFYYLPQNNIQSHKTFVSNLMRENLSALAGDGESIKEIFRGTLFDKSPFSVKFKEIYAAIDSSIYSEQNEFGQPQPPQYIYYNITDTSDTLYYISDQMKRIYNNLVYMKVLEDIYEISSRWPQVSWDEYYNDGYPYTLNWELVINNLAKVYIKDLQSESSSVVSAAEQTQLTRVNIGT